MVPDQGFRFKIVSNWMKEDGDENVEFEHEFSAITPDGAERHFGKDVWPSFRHALQFQRLIVESKGIPLVRKSGQLWIVSRMRKTGANDSIAALPDFCYLVPARYSYGGTAVQKGGPG